MSEARQSYVAQAILAYLAENPDAQDTLDGIAEWWLLERPFKTQTAAVKEALDELVSEGLVVERIGTDSQIHYRNNSRRSREQDGLLE